MSTEDGKKKRWEYPCDSAINQIKGQHFNPVFDQTIPIVINKVEPSKMSRNQSREFRPDGGCYTPEEANRVGAQELRNQAFRAELENLDAQQRAFNVDIRSGLYRVALPDEPQPPKSTWAMDMWTHPTLRYGLLSIVLGYLGWWIIKSFTGIAAIPW